MAQRGRPAFVATPAHRKLVELLVQAGYREQDIAECVGSGIAVETLRKHFRRELGVGQKTRIGKIAATMYQYALNEKGKFSVGDAMRAAMFILKCKGGWSEQNALSLPGEGETYLVKRIIGVSEDEV